jgi:hypothetical protein
MASVHDSWSVCTTITIFGSFQLCERRLLFKVWVDARRFAGALGTALRTFSDVNGINL